MSKKIILKGFNLVEAAIVLGVVGLVIGGIWTAAASVNQNARINETAQGMLSTLMNARALFPLSTYPTTPSSTVFIGSTLAAANAYPGNFQIVGNHAISPMGARIEVQQGCFTTCPMLGVKFYGPGATSYSSKTTGAECRQLVARFGSLLKDTSHFVDVHVQTASNSNYQVLVPPFDFNTIDCPNDFSQVVFWFKP